MDNDEKYTGYTRIALTVSSLHVTKEFLSKSNIKLTGSFHFKGMSATLFRDPDRNVIELDAYDECSEVLNDCENHP